MPNADRHSPLPPPPGLSAAPPDQEYEQIKQEILNETRSSRPSRLYHPAWTVAALVMFLGALLIHVSPRNRMTPGREAIVRAAAETPSVSAPEKERRPAPPRLPEARQPRRPTETSSYVPPILREAEDALNHPEQALPGPPPAPEPEEEPAALPAPASPQELDRYAADADLSGVLLMDSTPPGEPPELIARPTPIDVRQSISNLTTLVGMQIAEGEYDEARETLALLRRHDPRQADALMSLLLKAEEAARAEAEAAAAPAPTDKYFDSPLPDPPPEPAEPMPPQPEPPPEQPAEQLEIPAPPAEAIGDPAPEEREETAVFSPPLPEAVPVPADVPDVPEASSGAVPPTRWEHAAPRRVEPPAASLPAWRQTLRFTTDPYFREP